MEAINYLLQMTDWLLLIVPVGASAMVAYQSLRRTLTDDDGIISDCKRKTNNTIKGSIIAVSIKGFITIIQMFFK